MSDFPEDKSDRCPDEYFAWAFDAHSFVNGINVKSSLLVRSGNLPDLFDALKKGDNWSVPVDYLLITATYYTGESVRIPENVYFREVEGGKTLVEPLPEHWYIPVNFDWSENQDIIGEILHEQEFFKSKGYLDYDGFALLFEGKNFRDWIVEEAQRQGRPHEELFAEIFEAGGDKSNPDFLLEEFDPRLVEDARKMVSFPIVCERVICRSWSASPCRALTAGNRVGFAVMAAPSRAASACIAPCAVGPSHLLPSRAL